ncbi:MAG TPA: formimidoylglutamate deiminase [Acidobacteriota bacterium]|nr:formimidoylglutamate deiminase [Acidobacteriota bacterium]
MSDRPNREQDGRRRRNMSAGSQSLPIEPLAAPWQGEPGLGRDRIFQADWTWSNGRFLPDLQVAVGSDGRISEVGALERRVDVRLKNVALLPGFVNAHSHAFQRGLRGRGETFPEDKGSFWTWREEMYRLVESMDALTLLDLCRQAFSEMLAAGITSVGEFHYLHHDQSGEGYGLDEIVLEAAREAGIRMVLLNAFYRWSAPGRPLQGAQHRFATPSMEDFWEQMDRLDLQLDAQQSLGVAAHSLRAVGLEEAALLRREARKRALPFHIHVEEQQREIEECLDYYGARPLSLICDHLQPDAGMTSVHCTHSAAQDMKRYLEAGGGVLICPLTEANLGDGIADLPSIRALGGRIALGSDSNARISMLEEVRWLEYVQRLRREKRGVLCTDKGHNAAYLLECATLSGARSLNLAAGEIVAGRWADFCAVDLAHPALHDVQPSNLLAAVLLGCDNACIHSTWVSGQQRSGRPDAG